MGSDKRGQSSRGLTIPGPGYYEPATFIKDKIGNKFQGRYEDINKN